jgi:NADP-reducing hydrogenase subunit HndD
MQVIIDQLLITVSKDMTILEAARCAGVDIPHLCYHEDQSIKANCRVCIVELKGSNKLVCACSTRVWEGMEVVTTSKKIRSMQRGILELILANHEKDCLNCLRGGNCELQALCERFQIDDTSLEPCADRLPTDSSSGVLVREPSKCIKCGRCVEVCQEVQNVNVLTHSQRSTDFTIAPAYNFDLIDTECVFCGQCSAVCPTGAIVEYDDSLKVWDALENKSLHVIVQVAPAVRVSIGDYFGLASGTEVTGKLVTALRRLGFAKVFDTNFTADLTVMEEAYELIYRLEHNGVLPMLTSCSPGWVNYIQKKYNHLTPHLSTCKSPQQMFGALSKSYYADKINQPANTIFTVSIMPCTAKKQEAKAFKLYESNLQEVDVVLTTRELARMFKQAGILVQEQSISNFDNPFGIGSGAGVLFGTSGGVMEAALRTAYETLNKSELKTLEFKAVRGLEGFKETEVQVGDKRLNVAVVSGLGNARLILEQIDKGESPYHFIEVMACPGGCLGGGGQPIRSNKGVKVARKDALYVLDQKQEIRKSHINPAIITLYDEWLLHPLSEKSHHYLHTKND